MGLLRAAFRPEAEVCALRAVIRHRGELVQMAAQHVQHMHQALTLPSLGIAQRERTPTPSEQCFVRSGLSWNRKTQLY